MPSWSVLSLATMPPARNCGSRIFRTLRKSSLAPSRKIMSILLGGLAKVSRASPMRNSTHSTSPAEARFFLARSIFAVSNSVVMSCPAIVPDCGGEKDSRNAEGRAKLHDGLRPDRAGETVEQFAELAPNGHVGHAHRSVESQHGIIGRLGVDGGTPRNRIVCELSMREPITT